MLSGIVRTCIKTHSMANTYFKPNKQVAVKIPQNSSLQEELSDETGMFHSNGIGNKVSVEL